MTPGRCYKENFATESDARAALLRAKKAGRPERRIYYCRDCSAYHLTSKDNKPHPSPLPATMRTKP